MNNSIDIESWLKLARAKSVGPKTFHKLIESFESPQKVLGLKASDLETVEGIGIRTADKILASAEDMDVTDEIDMANTRGAYFVTMSDQRYPKPLKVICDPPPVLCVRGILQRNDSLAVGVVGSRRASYYGCEQASRFSHLLSKSGFTIISGMARGIDTAAHRGSLGAIGRTIAVQGCGLGKIFPPENAELFDQISQSGACISELPFNTDPRPENFPARNRIIAGLSMAVLVIEASLRSGAMITARLAMEYNREVMAVPGKVDSPLNEGSHKLIKQGAKLVDRVEDCMEALGYIGEGLLPHAAQRSKQACEQIEKPLRDISKLNLSSEEEKIYAHLGKEVAHLDDIVLQTNLAVGVINASLISLRLKGLIKQLPGNLFTRS